MMMNHSSGSERSDAKHPYPLSGDPATLSLHSLLIEEILSLGPMSFDKWMQHCLYHPDFGYYTKGHERVGRQGDFYTSVSVGACFGSILAERIAKYVQQHDACEILEIGANSGELANDILNHLRTQHPEVYDKICYTICEPLKQIQRIQSDTLAKHIEKLSHTNTLAEFRNTQPRGIILSNELIDAFPVKLITRRQQQWMERYIDYDGSTFQWIDQAITSPGLTKFTQSLPELPDGYQTEYRPGLESFASLCASSFSQSLSITIDYGYPSSVYYDTSRITGTLRCFYQHKADEAPLDLAGSKDITAHVDFTQLANSFATAGLSPQFFDSQTRYLTSHAAPLLKKIEQNQLPNSAKWIRQFQTLTHPSMMGNKFNVLECELNASAKQLAWQQLDLP